MRLTSRQLFFRKGRQLLVIAPGLLLVCFGLWLFWQRYQATHNSNHEISTETITHSTDKPDETPPKKCPNVVADQPREIRLPSLSKSGCIQKVSTDQQGRIAVPTNVHAAGWFVDSSLPGETGVSIIDGHADGRYADGIFKHLSKLAPADRIDVEFGDGSVRRFEAVSINIYGVMQTASEQFKQLEGIDRQLTIVTCGGNYNRHERSYDQRVVVRAKLL